MASLPHLFCDIDGTLAFQPEGDILAVNARFGTSWLAADAVDYPFSSMLPPRQAAWLRANRAVIAANLAPDTAAVHVLTMAVKAGAGVTVCTERDGSLEALTRAWCSYWGVPGAGEALTAGPGGKAALLEPYGPGNPCLLIDDSPVNASLARPGVEVWQPARPYNDGGGGVHRFSDWHDLKARLEK
jgi:hypothetical protein